MAADWIEVTSAAVDQPTLVYFVRHSDGYDALQSARPMAERLATATGARVLTVNCGTGGRAGTKTAVEAGLIAYAWLLGEGCDVTLTSFVSSQSDFRVVSGILAAAARRGLPAPAGGSCLAETLACRGRMPVEHRSR